jgi:carbonic anhydrase
MTNDAILNGHGVPETEEFEEEENFLKRMLAYNARWASQADSSMLAKNAKGQEPKVLWLGCADSRIPESLLCGTVPGEVFVHRNIANCFTPGDPSAMAVLAYAINNLDIRHVVVVGHYGCGGVNAAMSLAKARNRTHTNLEMDATKDEGQSNIINWLSPLRALAVAQLRSTPNGINGTVTPPSDDDESANHVKLSR